jgi:hypothetical protein
LLFIPQFYTISQFLSLKSLSPDDILCSMVSFNWYTGPFSQSSISFLFKLSLLFVPYILSCIVVSLLLSQTWALILHVLDGVHTDLVTMDSNVKFSAIQLSNVNDTNIPGQQPIVHPS